jgi:hypothetical protein
MAPRKPLPPLTAADDVRTVTVSFRQPAIAGMSPEQMEKHNREIEEEHRRLGLAPSRPPCERRIRVRRGRSPRRATNTRTRGSRRGARQATGTGSRAGPSSDDDGESDRADLAVGSSEGRP